MTVKTVQTSMLDFARDLIAIPTENPPGRDYAACVERIVAECDAHGLERRVVETGTADARRQVVLASAGDSGPLLYLHGHYDVVPAFDASQFSPRVEDGRLIGRGAADMKGGLAAILHAARPAAARGARIELVIVPDEETGGRYGSERLAELAVLDASAAGAILAEPTWGDDPRAAESIMLLGGLAGGGTNFNIVPDAFALTIDRRPNADEDYETAKTELLAALEQTRPTGFELDSEVLQDATSALTPPDEPLVGALAAAVAEVTGVAPTLTCCPGVLETRVYRALGIPAVAFGPGPIERMHAPEEEVPIANLQAAAEIYVETAAALAADAAGDAARPGLRAQ
jgi:succinyl-diaminopimelate desuccinylase